MIPDYPGDNVIGANDARSMEHRAKGISNTVMLSRNLVSIYNYVHGDHENATKRARTYEEYRGCLIEAVLGVRSESAGGFTPHGGYGPALLRRILKSFANYVTRIVAEAGATTTCATRRPYAWFRIRLAPTSAFSSSHQSISLCRFGHVSGGITLPGYSLMSVARSARLVERPWILPGIRCPTKGGSREAEWFHVLEVRRVIPEGRQREFSNGQRDVLIPISKGTRCRNATNWRKGLMR